jgi:hypothetical protein
VNPDDQKLNEFLCSAVLERLTAHDLLGVLDLGAPADEYRAEAEDFTRLISQGETVTPELVSIVWHKWFGDESEEPERPTAGMAALAADLRCLQRTR